jgi:YesN/AraC family two-component response regulator
MKNIKKIRVLIVEDQAVVREGLAAILSYQADIEVVGQAKDGIEAVEMLSCLTWLCLDRMGLLQSRF